MKPPKPVKPKTPDTNQPVRNNGAEDGLPPRINLPDSSSPGPSFDLPGSRRPEMGPDNTAPQPQIMVVDISTPGPAVITPTNTASDINFLPPVLVPKLSVPDANGLRHGQRNATYAEIENEGVTLVRRRDDGEYQASSASELKASGPVLERITGTGFWRRKDTGMPTTLVAAHSPEVRRTNNLDPARTSGHAWTKMSAY